MGTVPVASIIIIIISSILPIRDGSGRAATQEEATGGAGRRTSSTGEGQERARANRRPGEERGRPGHCTCKSGYLSTGLGGRVQEEGGGAYTGA